MRTIRKGPEPNQLTQHRHAKPEDYDGFPGKDELRRNLVREQRGLCCYCLSSIGADSGRMRIEHWRSQHSHPTEDHLHRWTFTDVRDVLGRTMP